MANKSNSRTKASRKYNDANYVQLNLRLPPKIVKGLKLYCNNKGISQRELISQLIYEKIERDTGKSFDEFLKDEEEPENPQELQELQRSSPDPAAISPAPDEPANTPEVNKVNRWQFVNLYKLFKCLTV